MVIANDKIKFLVFKQEVDGKCCNDVKVKLSSKKTNGGK